MTNSCRVTDTKYLIDNREIEINPTETAYRSNFSWKRKFAEVAIFRGLSISTTQGRKHLLKKGGSDMGMSLVFLWLLMYSSGMRVGILVVYYDLSRLIARVKRQLFQTCAREEITITYEAIDTDNCQRFSNLRIRTSTILNVY